MAIDENGQPRRGGPANKPAVPAHPGPGEELPSVPLVWKAVTEEAMEVRPSVPPHPGDPNREG